MIICVNILTSGVVGGMLIYFPLNENAVGDTIDWTRGNTCLKLTTSNLPFIYVVSGFIKKYCNIHVNNALVTVKYL